MPTITRRRFLGGAAAVPFALWFEQQSRAFGAWGVRVRHDARSYEGREMLASYARAVRAMQSAIEEGDPRSWVFQWYTHAVKGSTTKAAEIARIYPAPSPSRDLAGETWNTCQAHFPGAPEDNFLPWHRMFVFFFESIVREISGNPLFTLPYWNYSTCSPALRGVLPPELRMPDDPVYGPLFVAKRNPGVNDGQPIDEGEPGDPLSMAALAQCTYSPVDPLPGFNMGLDFGLHGNIHVLVGNTQNMGRVPWAAGDPVFWLHHCNVDRLWASWNAAGRTNPERSEWLDRSFVFADAAGTRVVATIRDFDAVAPLGYAYDQLEPVPDCPIPGRVIEAGGAGLSRERARASGLTLGGSAVRVDLRPPPGPAVTPAGAVSSIAPQGGKRLYLVARGLRAEVQPGALYHLYLGLPADADPAASERHLVGSVNFFAAEQHAGDGGGEAAAAEAGKFLSFDVTDLARSLDAEGALGTAPSLTVAPADQPAAEARAVVGQISLVER